MGWYIIKDNRMRNGLSVTEHCEEFSFDWLVAFSFLLHDINCRSMDWRC